MAGFIASAAVVLTVLIWAAREGIFRAPSKAIEEAPAAFVGRENCISCHQEVYEKWRDSHHDQSMAVADDGTVLGDFNDSVFEHGGIISRFHRRDGKYFVHTEGPDGEMADFEIAYTFGVDPLQQYLIPFSGGRLQSLTIAWDVQRRQWFHLYPGQDIPPDDWLHWTRGGQTWNGMCAECHSTNLRKGYHPTSKSYTTTWSEIDVSCEACHGPASRHVEWAETEAGARPEVENYGLVVATSGISSRQQVELCAPCHSRRNELGDYVHGRRDLLDSLVPSLLEEGLYFPDGQILEEVYVYGSFVQSKLFQNGVGCSDCHDVHSLKLLKEGNALCLKCHRADAYDSYLHHFHKKTHHGAPSDGARCIKCHMPERPYMVIDYRADHSIRVPRPDLTLEIGTPNACSQSGCHHDRPVKWLADHFERWYGQARKPHFGTTLAAGREARPEAQAALIRLAGDSLYPAIVRSTALFLLGSYPGKESTEAFTRALADEEALIRYTAVDHVGDLSLSADRLIDLAAPLLSDPVRAVRMQAAIRLAGISEELLRPQQRERLDKSLHEYVEAMEYSLDFSVAGHSLGNLYARLGKHEKAEKYYLGAIEIDDLFYPAKANLALLYNGMGRNEDAEALLREILRDYPAMHDAAYSLGLLLAETNRFPEAVTYL
ncbi:MAG: tetratricopeptide repeat protein, partial [Acidobacteriota bacterium]